LLSVFFSTTEYAAGMCLIKLPTARHDRKRMQGDIEIFGCFPGAQDDKSAGITIEEGLAIT